MKILGNRVLVSKIEEPAKEGFQTVDVQDNFVFKGKVEQIGTEYSLGLDITGMEIMFAKYCPDTQDIEHEGKKMKVVMTSDIIAVL